jgi:hypothetical protein
VRSVAATKLLRSFKETIGEVTDDKLKHLPACPRSSPSTTWRQVTTCRTR